MYVCGHLIIVNVEACTHLHALRSLHPLHWVTCVTKGEGTAEEQLKYSGCWWKYSIFVHGQVANFFFFSFSGGEQELPVMRCCWDLGRVQERGGLQDASSSCKCSTLVKVYCVHWEHDNCILDCAFGEHGRLGTAWLYIATWTASLYIENSLVPKSHPDFISAMQKNWEKAWEQNYITIGNGGLGRS